MEIENKLTLHFKKRETALKWLFAAAVYTALFSVLENPMTTTISMIGKNHHTLLAFFCFFYGAGMLINFKYTLRAFELKSPVFEKTAYIFNLAMGLVTTTLLPDKTKGGEPTLFATIAHWIFGFGGIIANATIILVFCLYIYKKTKSKKVRAVFVVGTTVAILDLLVFVGLTVITGDPQKAKNGLFEIVPIFVTFIVTYLLNHTDIALPRRERDEKEAMLCASDESTFTAVSYGALISAWIMFTTYMFVRSPIHYTISMTGLDYFGGYALTCLLLAAALTLNFVLMFKKHGFKNYFVIAVALVGSLMILPCVFKLTTLEKDINAVHAVSAVVFFFATLGAAAVFTLLKIKENKRYKLFFIVFAAIIAALIITSVLLFIVFDQRYGRTGLTELVPLEALFIFFYLENYTDCFSAERKEQSKPVETIV